MIFHDVFFLYFDIEGFTVFVKVCNSIGLHVEVMELGVNLVAIGNEFCSLRERMLVDLRG